MKQKEGSIVFYFTISWSIFPYPTPRYRFFIAYPIGPLSHTPKIMHLGMTLLRRSPVQAHQLQSLVDVKNWNTIYRCFPMFWSMVGHPLRLWHGPGSQWVCWYTWCSPLRRPQGSRRVLVLWPQRRHRVMYLVHILLYEVVVVLSFEACSSR